MPDTLKRTPMYDAHVEAGAKLVPFAGWEMPVQYGTGILEEHRAVRTRAGLFDVSHMGEVVVRGAEALELIQYLTTNDASTLDVGHAQYTVMCRENGGAIDDCIVYRFADHYMIVVNASNRDKDVHWIRTQASGRDVEVEDVSDDVALLALQGPVAQRILQPLAETDLGGIAYYRFTEGRVGGARAVISRTGYTGEDGFELYVPSASGEDLWQKLLDAGHDHGLIPAGLGARDSLRLEMGYALYGNDIDEERTPLEAGLGWVTKLDKDNFVGREPLQRQKDEGVAEKLVGFTLRERGFPRQGYPVLWQDQPVGKVTSGVHSPPLNVGIGLAYVPTEASKPGTALDILVRDKPVAAEVVRPPFYKNSSIRK